MLPGAWAGKREAFFFFYPFLCPLLSSGSGEKETLGLPL